MENERSKPICDLLQACYCLTIRTCIIMLRVSVCLQGLQIWQQQHAALADSFQCQSGPAADQEAANLSAVSNWISKPAQDVTSLIGFHLLALHQQVKPFSASLAARSLPSGACTPVTFRTSVHHSTMSDALAKILQMHPSPCPFARCLHFPGPHSQKCLAARNSGCCAQSKLISTPCQDSSNTARITDAG